MTSSIFKSAFLQSLTETQRQCVTSLSQQDVVARLCIDEKKSSEVTSSLKGQRAEQSIQDWIASKFPATAGFEIQYTAKTSHSGDIHLTFTDPTSGRIINMIIEIKDYKNKIPTKEVTKFKRDIEVQTPDIAMMISINSLITKFSKTEMLLFDTCGQTLCCYAHNINTFDPDRVVLHQIVSFLLKSAAMANDGKTVDDVDNVNTQILCNQIKEKMIPFNNITQDLYKMQDDLSKKIRNIVAKMVESVTNVNAILK